MQQWRVLCVLIAVVVTISVAGATAVAAAQPSTATQPTAEQPASIVAQQEEVEADDIRITITLTEDGAAEWAVSFRSVLDTEERREAFAELQADIEADPESYTAPFADRIDNTVATASNALTARCRPNRSVSMPNSSRWLGSTALSPTGSGG